MSNFTHTELRQIADALDTCRGLSGQPLSPSDRARIHQMLEHPTWANWVDSRRIKVRPDRTLWQVAALTGAVGPHSKDVPTPGALISALAVCHDRTF